MRVMKYNGQLVVPPLCACNKLSTPNQDIIRCECLAPLLGLKLIPYFIKLYNTSPDNILFFSDNISFICMVRNFHKNFTSYKAIFLRTIKPIFYTGILAHNFFSVQSVINVSDFYTRLSTMEFSTMHEILGNYENGSFDLNSNILGAFNFQKYFDEIKSSPRRSMIAKYREYMNLIG